MESGFSFLISRYCFIIGVSSATGGTFFLFTIP